MDRNSPGIKYCILCKKVCPTSEALDEHFRSHKSMKFGSNNTGNEVVHETKTQKDGASEGIYQYSENFTEALNKLHSLFSQLGEERLKNTKLLLVEVTDEDANTTIKNLEKLVGHNKIVDLTKEEIKVKHVPLTEKNVQPIKEYNIFQNVPMSTASGIPLNVDDVINKEVISPVINESFINASRTRTDKGIELDKSSNIGNAFSNESKSLQTPSTVETEMNFEFVRDDVKADVSKSIIDKYSAKLRSIQWIKDTLLQNQVETPKDYKPFAEDLYDSDNDKKKNSVNTRNRSSSRPSTHNRHVNNVQQNERRNYRKSYEDRFDSPRHFHLDKDMPKFKILVFLI
uniref:C2H2-type domain-containing protein n=1 Tax=Parastrongyloides trichosuri TaxID=131310 RepID=A0A0N4ZB67_PARTI